MACDYCRERPWDYVFRKLIDPSLCFTYWKKELEDPAMMVLAHAVPASVGTSSQDGIISHNGVEHVAGAAGGAPQGSSTGASSAKRPVIKPQKDSRAHNVDSQGHFTTNRAWKPLCAKFQQGLCTGTPCPENPSQQHQCNRCLSQHHGGESGLCGQDKGGKGKGKGKGKKGGKKGGKVQY